jgi:hypothetical protein
MAFAAAIRKRAIRIAGAGLLALLWLAGLRPALAHNTGAGEDVALARLTAVVSSQTATVRVEVQEPDECERLAPRGLVGQRAGSSASGTLARAGACAFEGTIELPERGRWMVDIQLDYAGRAASVSLPVPVSGEPQAQELVREDWIHALAAPQRTWSDRVGDYLPYAGIGLAVGLALVAARRVRKAPRGSRRRTGRADSSPEQGGETG